MRVSLIIPTYNAQEYILKLMKALESQTLNFELIIIDSSSSDNTVEIAKEYADNIIVIPQKEFDHGGTRTEAGEEANGDILVYLTQDALPFDKYAIKNIIEPFKNPKVGACYGRQLSYKNTNPFGKHLREFNYGKKSYIRELKDSKEFGIKTAFLSDSFSAYRKSALESVGWLKDGLIVGEDTHTGAKLILTKWAIAYSAKAKVYHSHSYTILQEFRRYFDIGVFHKRESWILEAFGKAEGEGGRYVKSEFKYLISNGLYHLLFEFIARNGMKYLGYKLGYNYQKLSKGLIEKFTMHPLWWKKDRGNI